MFAKNTFVFSGIRTTAHPSGDQMAMRLTIVVAEGTELTGRFLGISTD